MNKTLRRFIVAFVVATPILAVTPQEFGAQADAQKVSDAVVASGTAIVTSATANFEAKHMGLKCYGVENSTGNLYMPFGQIIDIISATQVECSVNAIGSATDVRFVWGHDDSDFFIEAKEEAQTYGKPLVIPAGKYMVRKRIPGVSYASSTATFPVRGDGSGVTIIYVCPDFDYTGVATYSPLIGGNLGHANGASWSGFTLDGCDGRFNHPMGGINDIMFPICGGLSSRLEDVRIENFKHIGTALRFYGNCLMTRCHVEDAGSQGIFWYGEGMAFHNYTGNIDGVGLKVYGVTGNGPFKWIGGIVDECAGANSVEVEGSIDTHFIGAQIYAGVGRTALKVDAASQVAIASSQLLPYGSHWGSALNVSSGGRVTVENSRLKGVASGSSGKAITGAKDVVVSPTTIIEGDVTQ